MLNQIKNIIKSISPKYQKLILDYPVNLAPRYTEKNIYFKSLLTIIEQHKEEYIQTLSTFLNYKKNYYTISENKFLKDRLEPGWNNGFLPGLDIISLYGIISNYNPKIYLEIGSGNSTKVTKKAIKDHNLQTRIISIDPAPRTEIDNISDEIIRLPVEQVDIENNILSRLNAGDILFIDNSHRVLPNSDSLVCFLEIMPFLKKGVIVHIHDIYLPYDYPQIMCDRFYNEQYFLALLLTNNILRYKPLLPNFYIYKTAEIFKIIDPVFQHENLINVERHGGSFWLEIL